MNWPEAFAASVAAVCFTAFLIALVLSDKGEK